jgi:RNA polymerase sigma factor (sigma-70 family)
MQQQPEGTAESGTYLRDDEAWQTLALENQALVRNVVLRVLRSQPTLRQGVEDVVQTVWLKALRQPAYQDLPSRPAKEVRALLCTVARNAAIDLLGKGRPWQASDVVDDDGEPLDDGDRFICSDDQLALVVKGRAERYAILRACILELEYRLRRALELREQGLTFAKIGEKMECSEAMVRKLIREAHEVLRRKLIAHGVRVSQLSDLDQRHSDGLS